MAGKASERGAAKLMEALNMARRESDSWERAGKE